MSEKITLEIKKEYEEHLELLKQVIPNREGWVIVDNGEMIEALIDSFIGFLQEQAAHHNDAHDHEGGCCWHDH